MPTYIEGLLVITLCALFGGALGFVMGVRWASRSLGYGRD